MQNDTAEEVLAVSGVIDILDPLICVDGLGRVARIATVGSPPLKWPYAAVNAASSALSANEAPSMQSPPAVLATSKAHLRQF